MKFRSTALGCLYLAATLASYSKNTYTAVDLSAAGFAKIFDLNDQQLIAGSDANELPVFGQPDYIYYLSAEPHHLSAAGYVAFSNGLIADPVSRVMLNNKFEAVLVYKDSQNYFWRQGHLSDMALLGYGSHDLWYITGLGDDSTITANLGNTGISSAVTLNTNFFPKVRYLDGAFPNRANREGTLPLMLKGGLMYSDGSVESAEGLSAQRVNDLNVALADQRLPDVYSPELWESGEYLPLGFTSNRSITGTVFLNNWSEVALVFPVTEGEPELEVTFWRGGKVTRLSDELDFAAAGILNLREVVAFNNLGQLAVMAERADHLIVPLLLNPSSTAEPPARLLNASIRAHVTPSDEPVIVGAVTSGNSNILIRAVGPGLTPFGVTDASANPTLFVSGTGEATASNDDWSASDSALAIATAASGAFALQNGSTDSAILWSQTEGSLTGIMRGAEGTGLLELFDATGDAASHLINVSGRVSVGGANGSATLGFVVSEGRPARVLIRAVGPSLTKLGVPNALADPKIRLRSGANVIGVNDHWTRPVESASGINLTASETSQRVGAFELDPYSKDALLMISLPPGAYTAEVSSADGSTGTVLIEVYLLPPATDLIPDMVPL